MARLTLAEFLQQDAAREWKWGTHDCGLRLADWISASTGRPDPAAHLRRLYASESECADALGSVAVLRQAKAILRNLGFPRTNEPVPGDIAVIDIRAAGERVVCGAIRLDGGWSVPGSHGLTRLPDGSVRVIAAWRLPRCHL